MVSMTDYAKRRQTLMQKIGQNDLVILSAADECPRNGDTTFPFRQHSDFYYLTGFDEPDAVLVLAPKRKEGEYILFNRVRDRDREIWDGPRAGQEGAASDFLADQSFPIAELEEKLPDLLSGRHAIHYALGSNPAFDELLLNSVKTVRTRIRSGISAPQQFVDINPTLHEMRIFKSPAEIALMQKAVDITVSAHERAMRTCKPGMNECELEAELMHEFQRHGARFPAYTSIVASGRNACILHYVQNNQTIADGDLILIDAGAEYQNYAADITRTFPANGKFTEEQRAIYELVLDSQLAAIESIKPGSSWLEAQHIIVNVLTEGLVELGILKGDVAKLIEERAYLPFYMHRSGHFLGLDVHDAGSYHKDGKWRALEAGMVLTVEPGLYISADTPGVDKRWHNIGVRIEDDVLVTEKGHEVLSRHLPKEVKDIEALMAKK